MSTPDAPAAVSAADGITAKITRDTILAAALEIIDRDGIDALSMRRLARALNRDPMILYRHAPNKAALLDGVAETVLAQLRVDSGDSDWAGQLRKVARRFGSGRGRLPACPPAPSRSGSTRSVPARSSLPRDIFLQGVARFVQQLAARAVGSGRQPVKAFG